MGRDGMAAAPGEKALKESQRQTAAMELWFLS